MADLLRKMAPNKKNARKQTHIKIQFYNRKKVTSFKIFILTFSLSPNEQGNGDGAHLQGQAEEPLGVVEEEAKLIPTTFRHCVRRPSSWTS